MKSVKGETINQPYAADNYPRIDINLNLIVDNAKKIVKRCENHGIMISVVTKLVCGNSKIVESLANTGVEMLSDSRIENIMKYRNCSLPKMMLRLPMASQVKRVVELCDVSLVSDLEMMGLLSEAAMKMDLLHQVIVMIDMGDLREGIFYEDDIHHTFKRVSELEGIQIIGIGTNLSCYGGVMPTPDLLKELVALKDELNDKFALEMELVSGGNSGVLTLLEKEGKLPKGINHLRLGASIFMGIGLNDEPIEYLNQKTFQLVCEVIEVKKKPSVPVGEIGLDAFGNIPVFEDKGEIIRCICAIGRQDVSPFDLVPCDKDLVILGASSDHLILDVTQSKTPYQIGDEVTFDLTYGGCLSLMTSEYVHKRILHADR